MVRDFFGSALCFICCPILSVAIVFVGEIQWFVAGGGGQALCVCAFSVSPDPTTLNWPPSSFIPFLSWHATTLLFI